LIGPVRLSHAGVATDREERRMIVVIGRARTDGEKREAFLRVALAGVSASRGDPGCINYGVFEDGENENAFVFIEEWESNEALKEHFATAHIREFMQAIPDTLVAPPDVKFHTIASSMDLADVGSS
jgi:quinol monooxygenase YgiN